MMRTVIKNGIIYDGTGKAPFEGSIVIDGERIESVVKGSGDGTTGAEACAAAADEGNLRVIDAAGRYITPGFIDQHRHADLAIFRDSFGPQELSQGLTTINTGVCGFSCAPCGENSDMLYQYAEPILGTSGDAEYRKFQDYISAARRASAEGRLSINASTLQGLGAIRIAVKGFDPSPYTKEEIRKAQELVEEAIDSGVRGFSTGLIYNPEMYTSTEEMQEILKPCRGRNLLFMPHIRNEAGTLPEAVAEAIEIAETNEMALSISHFKAIGPENWHVKLDKAIKEIEAARSRGMDVTVDVYPYHGTSTTLSSVLPYSFLNKPFEKILAGINTKEETDRLRKCYLEPGPKDNNLDVNFRWNTTLITGVALKENEKYLGKSVNDAFKISGYPDLYEFLGNLLYTEKGSVCMVELAMDDEDVENIMRLPYSMIISDSLYSDSKYPHPRAYAMCQHMIKEYVLGKRVLSMEEAVRKMTSLQAERMGFEGRGSLKAGNYADVLVFDPEKLGDNATFDNGKVMSTGIDYAFVNGTLCWHNERQTAKAGKYLL